MPEALRLTGGHFDCIGGDRCGYGAANWWTLFLLRSVMPPELLFDLSEIDLLGEPVFDKEAILRVNAQRFEMQQLDGILWYDKDKFQILGYKDVTAEEFWIRGHIPERPLMPGVIMVEAAAQLSSFLVKQVYEFDGFIGFAGIDSAKFRAVVEPGQRLYLLGHLTKFKRRKYTCSIQGVVDGTMVFETVVSGMKV
jgi:3-hydroxyacyl-[acyl-carrier-protein] dehydratase